MKPYDPLELGLPAAVNHEKFVIGTILQSCDATAALLSIRHALTADEFSIEPTRLTWQAICHLADSGLPLGLHSVAQHLNDSGHLQIVGGIAGLMEFEGVPDVGLDGYVRILLDKSARRRGIRALHAALLRLSGPDDAAETLAAVESMAADASSRLANDTGFRTIESIIGGAGGLDGFLVNRSTNVVPVPWLALENILTASGFRGGQLVILAGPPGKGKSAMAVALAKHAGRRTEKAIPFISLEMGGEELVERLIASESGINTRDLAQRGNGSRVNAAAFRLSQERLLICDSTTQSLSAIRARLKRQAARGPIGMVVIDYLQLIETSGRKENRATALGEVSRGLKLLAKELDIPILALSQLSRESRKENREPELYDLRESGSIEQDADIVLMIHFDRDYDVSAGVPEGDLKLLVRKQRNGAMGAVRLLFHAPTGTFREPGEDRDEE